VVSLLFAVCACADVHAMCACADVHAMCACADVHAMCACADLHAMCACADIHASVMHVCMHVQRSCRCHAYVHICICACMRASAMHVCVNAIIALCICMFAMQMQCTTAPNSTTHEHGRQTYQPAKFSNIQLLRPVTSFCTETNSQCIAYSGVVHEPLLTHDPSRSRFRVSLNPPKRHPSSKICVWD